MGCRCKEKKRTVWNQRQAEQAAAGQADEQTTTAQAASAYLAGVNDATETQTATDRS